MALQSDTPRGPLSGSGLSAGIQLVHAEPVLPPELILRPPAAPQARVVQHGLRSVLSL
jgi:hypothetical protein